MAANDNHCHHDLDSPDETDDSSGEVFIEALPFASQFAIWAARIWVTALKSAQPFETLSGNTFRQFNLSEAQRSLDEFFLIVAHAADRQIDIRCTRCRYVSADEMVFHRALAAVQNGLAFQAYNELRQWLPPAAARIAFNALTRLGTTMAQAKLVLRAYGEPTRTTALSHAMTEMPSRSVH
jgi:hypothetical protein